MTRDEIIEFWMSLTGWVQANIPMAGEMRGYLNLPHHDSFGQRELERLRAVEDEIDGVLWRLEQTTMFDLGHEALMQPLEELKARYKSVWRDILNLFARMYQRSFVSTTARELSPKAQDAPTGLQAQDGHHEAEVVTAYSNFTGATDMGIPIDVKPTPRPGHYLGQIASIEASEGKFGPQLKVGFNLGSGMELTSYFPAKATPKNKTGELLKAAFGTLQPLSDSDILIGCKINLLLEILDGKDYPSIKSMWPVKNGTPDAEIGI